jgi:uncharacterized protein
MIFLFFLQEEAASCMVTIYVDADAMPRDALAVIDRVAKQFHADVITVSSVNHHFDRPNHITVDPHPQAADMAIVGMLKKGTQTVVVTQDYGLAALALGQGARALSPHGLVFSEMNMDRLLFERDIHARERRQTGRSRGPKPRTTKDTEQFEKALVQVLIEFPSSAM